MREREDQNASAFYCDVLLWACRPGFQELLEVKLFEVRGVDGFTYTTNLPRGCRGLTSYESVPQELPAETEYGAAVYLVANLLKPS